MAFFASVRANKNALAGGASIVGAGVGVVRVLSPNLAQPLLRTCAFTMVYYTEFDGCGGNTPC